MIVCHCAGISDKDISNAVEWMRASDPQAIVTPGRLYQILNKSPDCGGCMSLFVATMRRGLEDEAVPQLRPIAARHASEFVISGEKHEGRSKGHRVSKRRTA